MLHTAEFLHGPIGDSLFDKQIFVDTALSGPLYERSIDVLRSVLVVKQPHLPLARKAKPMFEQHSPVGASRIVANAENFSKHIDDAVNKASIPSSRVWEDSPKDLQAAVRFVSSYLSDPSALARRRATISGVIDHVSQSLKPMNDSLIAYAPPHVRSLPTSINIAFLSALADAISFPDKLLPAKLLFGSPVVGDIPAPGVFRPNVKWATRSASSFDRVAWTEKLHKRIRSYGLRSTQKSKLAARKVILKTMEEVDAPPPKGGWTLGPFSKSEMYERFPDGFWPSERFGVLQKGEIRPCDNCRDSYVNDCSTTRESISSDGADFPAQLAAMYYSLLGPAAEIRGGCDDWKKAYRQIPVDDPSTSVVACWDPDKRQVIYFVVKGHVFGAVHAVNSFNVVAKFLTVACRAVYGATCGNYFDDHVVVEPEFARDSAQLGLACLSTALGFLFDPDKHSVMASIFVYLGVQNDFTSVPRGVSMLRIIESRRKQLVELCDAFLRKGSMSHGEAASLRGKLYFAATSAYGKVGRAALQPILQRQEGKVDSSDRLTPSMVLALKFFITLLNHMPDREIHLGCADRKPLLVWSDASWEKGVGWLGFVVYDPQQARFFYSDSHVPSYILEFFIAKKQKIGQCEILAALMVYTSMPETFRDRDVIHWIDNTSAISCLLHGYSGKVDSALMVNAFHLFNAGLRARIHFEYVESKANVADLPSRQEFVYLLLSLAARRVPTFIHPSATWSGPMRHFIASSSPPENSTFRSPRRKRPRSSIPGDQRGRAST